MLRPITSRPTVKGVARIKPIGPQSVAQNAAEATMAKVESPVILPKKSGSSTWPTMISTTKIIPACHKGQGPAIADGGSDDNGKHG